ncbi:MAG: hypothetical protein GY756_23340 [bacterium]|nr:hypothetical protein [bacterium]
MSDAEMNIKIDINEEGLTINEIQVKLPIDLKHIISIIGKYSDVKETEENNIYVWNNIGIVIYMNKSDSFESLFLTLGDEKWGSWLPKNNFSGTYIINGTPYQKIKFKEEVIGNFSVSNFYNSEDKTIKGSDISEFTAPEPINDPDRYKQKEFKGEALQFKDFNFKLAVLEILMYEKELIKPKFDLYEFVERYSEREIDIEDEGYDFIPEVNEYFKNLQIDKKFASQIIEIDQDGNEIHSQLICFWNGEDDRFNIQSAEDAEKFSNLKKVTLFYEDKPVVKNQFINMGIKAEYI